MTTANENQNNVETQNTNTQNKETTMTASKNNQTNAGDQRTISEIMEGDTTDGNTNQTVSETQNENTNDSIKEGNMTVANNIQIETEATNDNPQIIEVPIEKLVVPDSHPRKYQGDMKSLKESINCNGLLEPLTVCKSEDGDNFMVIDGTRRFAILTELKKTTVSCIVMDSMPLGQIAHVAYVKNAERENLSVIEIGMHLKAMKGKFKYSLRDLKMKGYGSAATIGNHINLLKLTKEIQNSLHEGKLTLAHGLALLKLPTSTEQNNWAETIEKDGISAKKAEKMITTFIKKGNQPAADPKAINPIAPGVFIKDASDMIEISDESVHLIVAGISQLKLNPLDSSSKHFENIRSVMDECNRVLVKGGIMALNIMDTLIVNKNEGNMIEAAMYRYQNFLKQHKIRLTDVIHWIAPEGYRKNNALKGLSEETRHTTYSVQSLHSPIYIFRKSGERKPQADETVRRSRLSEKEWSEWCTGVWEIQPANDGEYPEIFPEELLRRLIKMFSFEGDTVLDPFLGTGTTVKVARKLHREGIGYERDPELESTILNKLGETQDAGTKDGMADYAKQSMENEDIEQIMAQAEAEVANKFFGDEVEVAETVAAE